jgi:Zn-dependent protease
LVVHGTAPLDQLESIEDPRIELLGKLASVNIMLVLFNLIPAFPMDGGRVLRALLAMVMPYARATWVAARIGQGLAICLALYSYFGPGKNPILIFIAFFIFVGAQQEAAMVRMRQTPPPPPPL